MPIFPKKNCNRTDNPRTEAKVLLKEDGNIAVVPASSEKIYSHTDSPRTEINTILSDHLNRDQDSGPDESDVM